MQVKPSQVKTILRSSSPFNSSLWQCVFLPVFPITKCSDFDSTLIRFNLVKSPKFIPFEAAQSKSKSKSKSPSLAYRDESFIVSSYSKSHQSLQSTLPFFKSGICDAELITTTTRSSENETETDKKEKERDENRKKKEGLTSSALLSRPASFRAEVGQDMGWMG